MKRDIKDFGSQKPRSKYCRVNKLLWFLDVQSTNLFVMYAMARFQIKFEQTMSYMVPIFYLITSSGSMFDLIQLLKFYIIITSPKLPAHYVNYRWLLHQMSSEFGGIHSIMYVLADAFTKYTITQKTSRISSWNKNHLDQQYIISRSTSRTIWGCLVFKTIPKLFNVPLLYHPFTVLLIWKCQYCAPQSY
jgi:hypothetical protein